MLQAVNQVANGAENAVENAASSTVESVEKGIGILGELEKKGISLLADYGPKIVAAILILWISIKLINFLCKKLNKILNHRQVDPSLVPFFVSATSITLKLLVFLSVVGIVGIPMTSFVALIGAVGLAIGMAFSGTLSNVAGGVVILVLRPFKVGDYIAAQGFEGTVKAIQIFNTVLITPDNKVITIPNGPLSTGPGTDFSLLETRRLDINVKLAHGEDTAKIQSDILEILHTDPRIKKDPVPQVIHNITDASVTLSIRFWVATPDYWPINGEINQKVYQYLFDNSIAAPYQKILVEK